MSDQSLKAAIEAAAKVNAMLVATGQLRPSDLSKGKAKSGKSTDLFVEEVIINDAPMSARNYLTRSFTQEEISKMSGASVSTRGRYMTTDEIENNNSSDRPLYLHIQGINQQDVKVAVGRIMHLIMEHTHRKNLPKVKGQNAVSGGSHLNERVLTPPSENVLTSGEPDHLHFPPNLIREKVFLPSTIGLNPIDVRLRLLGENNSNLKYILDETGAALFLRGIGSGYIEPSIGFESQEPLHFYLEHHNQEKFNEAKDLVVNLAQTILAQIYEEQSALQLPPPTIPFQQNLPPAPLNGLPPPPVQHVLPPPSNSQLVVSAVGHQLTAGVVPQQLNVQLSQLPVPQVAQGPSPLIVTPEIPPGNQALHSQDLSHVTIQPGTHLVQISVPTSQQVVQAPVGPHFLQIPHGTQIVTTPEGPRLVALTSPNSVSTAFVTPAGPANVSEQTSLGLVIPQHISQAPPPVPQSSGQVPYAFEAEAIKHAPTPTMISSTPTTTTFVYMHPPPTLQEEAIPQISAPSSVTIEDTHSQWSQATGSITFTQLNVPAPPVEFPAHASSLQVTHIPASYTNHLTESYQSVPSHGQLNVELRREWNMGPADRSPTTQYSQDQMDATGVFLGVKPEGLVADVTQKISSSTWPYNQEGLTSLPNPIRDVSYQHFGDFGGRNQQYDLSEYDPTKQLEQSQQEGVSYQDSKLYGRKAASPGGGLAVETKRRRSFMPKGDDKYETGQDLAYLSGRREELLPTYGEQDPASRFHRMPLEQLVNPEGANYLPQDVRSPIVFSTEYPPPQLPHTELPLHQGVFPPDVPPFRRPRPNHTAWQQWNSSRGAPLMYPPPITRSNFGGDRPPEKHFESPWESGIPGVPPGPRGQPHDPYFLRPRFPRNRRF